jgi:hypothetical protein
MEVLDGGKDKKEQPEVTETPQKGQKDKPKPAFPTALDKVMDDVREHLETALPKAIEGVKETMEKASVTVTVEMGYNKHDELVTTVGGRVNIPMKKSVHEGEILDGQLHFW